MDNKTKSSATLRVGLSIAALLLFGACGSVFDDSHASDATLISRFEVQQSDFERLLEMAKQDSHVVRIAYDFTWTDTNYHWPRADSELGFSTDRWEQYRSMFSKLGLKGGIAWSSDGSLVLIASTRGLSIGGSAKGYAFSSKPLTPTIDSLDSAGSEIKNGKLTPGLPVYRRIKDSWYLYYEGN